jgi:hypothetical protein
VGGSAQRDYRTAGFYVVDNVLHLDVGQIAESREQDHQVGRVEGFQSWDVVALIRIDGAILWVNREQHRAIEAVTLRENPGELWHSLL